MGLLHYTTYSLEAALSLQTIITVYAFTYNPYTDLGNRARYVASECVNFVVLLLQLSNRWMQPLLTQPNPDSTVCWTVLFVSLLMLSASMCILFKDLLNNRRT